MTDMRPSSPEGVGPERAATLPAVLDGEVIPPKGDRRCEGTSKPAAGALTTSRGMWSSTALLALACVALLGVGAAGTVYEVTRHRARSGVDPTAAALDRLQREVGTLKTGVDSLHPALDLARQDETVRALKKSVDTLKAELDAQRGSSAAGLAQLNTKLDKPDRETTQKLADLMARIDRLDRDPSAKLGEISARLDRIERQVSSPAATGSIVASSKPPALPIAAPAADKLPPKPATLGNWVVRDVYDGIALVEGRGGGIREVMPGERLPGAGEVRSIERRGNAWIVVTSRGIIDNATW